MLVIRDLHCGGRCRPVCGGRFVCVCGAGGGGERGWGKVCK
jgi:hypothetical protein